MKPCPCGVKPDNHAHDKRNGKDVILYWTAYDEEGKPEDPEKYIERGE